MEQTIKVSYYKGKNRIKGKYLSWPQKYENFIQDIIETFNIKNINIKINLKVVSYGLDEILINSKEEFEDYSDDNNIKEFKFFIEEIKEQIIVKNFEELIDKKLLNESEEIDVDYIINDIFNSKDYQKNKENEEIKYTNFFKQNLEKNMNDILSEKSLAIQDIINSKISEYNNLSLQLHKEEFNSMLDFQNKLTNMKNQADQISIGLKDWQNSLQKKQKNKFDIKFGTQNIEKILDINDSSIFYVDGIKIINIGNHSYKNLILVKDNTKSSKEIYFFNYDKNGDIKELAIDGYFEPKNSGSFRLSLTISNPKINQIYKMVIYVREKGIEKNLSEPFEIIVRLTVDNKNKEEDPYQKKQKMAEELYKELNYEFMKKIKNDFNEELKEDLENLIIKSEIIEKLMKNNLNKDKVAKYLNDKIFYWLERKLLNEKYGN